MISLTRMGAMMTKIIVDLSKTKYTVISVFTQMKTASTLTTRTHEGEKKIEIEKEKPVRLPQVKQVENSNLIILKSTQDFLHDIVNLN